MESFRGSEIQQISVKWSLLCPISKNRIEIPGRSKNCNHLQCFDLKNFLFVSWR